jgi:hypothetical protein
VQVLTETEHPDEYWADLKAREPALARLAESVEFQVDEDGRTVTTDALDLEGVLRLIQSIPSPRAERIKRWMAESARQRIEEAENPELALVRARKLYEQRGYSRRWIDKRLRGVSARHELTAEWFRRGARESEQYRALTNELIRSAFGMDVEGYRRYKGLSGTSANLRDHMTDLELALVTLAETTAAVLHRGRGSEGFERLLADVRDAGRIVAATAAQIAQGVGAAVTQPVSRVGPRSTEDAHDRAPAQTTKPAQHAA